ncbi:hypothetical protein PVAND_017792 [Polypedilum vanderplanki]|uniref:DUF4806 domain-containing protein n=1 Tax=Polypedilum vanderplanki TaxID=319348 RepID=A0A9J6B9C2_POLVA|nr:hypothetical protein PVAND_017792 [Polypedilum vanderplanki]
MYKVVKNSQNQFYVVADRWIVENNNKKYSFYPPYKLLNKALSNKMRPDSSWTNELITEVSKSLEYAEAVAFMKKKVSHIDTSSENESEKRKNYNRKHPAEKVSTKFDFNQMFEQENSFYNNDNKKQANEIVNNSSGYDQIDPMKNNSDLDFADSEIQSKNLFESPNDSNEGKYVGAQVTEDMARKDSYVIIPSQIWETVVSAIGRIETKVDTLQTKNDEQFVSLIEQLKEFKRSSLNTMQQMTISQKPSKIKDREKLEQEEINLEAMNSEIYLKKVKDIASVLRKPSKAFSNEHGLVRGFMDIYFDENFLKTVGWTKVKGRIPFEKYKSHHKLIFDTCNMHTANLFNNIEAATNSITVYFKRLHENKKK